MSPPTIAPPETGHAGWPPVGGGTLNPSESLVAFGCGADGSCLCDGGGPGGGWTFDRSSSWLPLTPPADCGIGLSSRFPLCDTPFVFSCESGLGVSFSLSGARGISGVSAREDSRWCSWRLLEEALGEEPRSFWLWLVHNLPKLGPSLPGESWPKPACMLCLLRPPNIVPRRRSLPPVTR